MEECIGQTEPKTKTSVTKHDWNLRGSFSRVATREWQITPSCHLRSRWLLFRTLVSTKSKILLIMLQLLFENVFYSLPLSLIEISWTTDRLQGRVSYETKTERKISNYPSENCLTYMSGENMGRRPSSSHTHSPTVKRAMRGIPDLVQCHESWALFSSSAWRVNQLYSVTAFSSIQFFFTRNNLHSFKRSIQCV